MYVASTSIVHTVDKLICAQSEARVSSETLEKYGNYCEPLVSDTSKRMHNSDQFSHNSQMNLQPPVKMDFSMETSSTIDPLQSNCIKQLYKDKGPTEGSNGPFYWKNHLGFCIALFLVN